MSKSCWSVKRSFKDVAPASRSICGSISLAMGERIGGEANLAFRNCEMKRLLKRVCPLFPAGMEISKTRNLLGEEWSVEHGVDCRDSHRYKERPSHRLHKCNDCNPTR